MEKTITVHIADDHQILIDGVKAVLDLEANIEVIGYSLNGLQVVEWFNENQADVLVLDINMPEMDGWKASGEIRRRERANGSERPPVPIVALTASLPPRTLSITVSKR